MVERILSIVKRGKFDFRHVGSPSDPLAHLFEEWVPYYLLKYAVARALQPKSILEIGVRFGYSARAFLEASPRASYLGIDNRSEEFGGGGPDAALWAVRILAPYDAKFIEGDSQQMTSFPGQHYDLTHVDGQQDGEGMYRDLWKAFDCSTFVLLDGFTWTRKNYEGVSRFLLDRRRDIDYYFVIPGYAGELLIKVAEEYRDLRSPRNSVICPPPSTWDEFDRDESLRRHS